VNDDVTVAIAHFADIRIDVLMILDSGSLAWTLSAYSLQFGDDFRTPAGTGTDITGDGAPNMVVSAYSGGAHCCSTYHVFALPPEVKQLAAVETHDSSGRFVAYDAQTALVIETGDNTFAYWNIYFAALPDPTILLAWNGDAYEPATDLMATPVPSAEGLKQKADAVAASDQWTADQMDPDLWREMLDLIYTGHNELAWEFFENGWPHGREGKEDFRTNFRCQLAQSPYWQAISVMNSLGPNDVPGDCSSNTGY
tara:strand:+ start:26643 stop:27404 length:762 start_codon:yes stop_codon:yes gene_type:complete